MMNRYIKSGILVLIIGIVFFVVTRRVEFKMLQEYVLKGNYPLPASGFDNINISICDNYIHNEKEFDKYKLWLQKNIL